MTEIERFICFSSSFARDFVKSIARKLASRINAPRVDIVRKKIAHDRYTRKNLDSESFNPQRIFGIACKQPAKVTGITRKPESVPERILVSRTRWSLARLVFRN